MALLEFSLEVGDKKTRIIDGIAGEHGYRDQITGPDDEELIPNPETKPEFVKRMLIKWVKDNVKSYEAKTASVAARDTAIVNADFLVE